MGNEFRCAPVVCTKLIYANVYNVDVIYAKHGTGNGSYVSLSFVVRTATNESTIMFNIKLSLKNVINLLMLCNDEWASHIWNVVVDDRCLWYTLNVDIYHLLSLDSVQKIKSASYTARAGPNQRTVSWNVNVPVEVTLVKKALNFPCHELYKCAVVFIYWIRLPR